MPCTTILVGKKASNDGSTMIARNDDGRFDVKKIKVVEKDKQPKKYKENVLPSSVRTRVAIEAGSTQCWYKYVGLDGDVIGMTTFGASAPYPVLQKHFGFTVENVCEKVKKIIGK